MPGSPNISVAKKLRAKGPFKPNAKLDPSQVVDERMPAPMRYTKWEDGSASWYPDPKPGGLKPPGQAMKPRKTGLATYNNQIK